MLRSRGEKRGEMMTVASSRRSTSGACSSDAAAKAADVAAAKSINPGIADVWARFGVK